MKTGSGPLRSPDGQLPVSHGTHPPSERLGLAPTVNGSRPTPTRLVLFFTFPVSLHEWAEAELLEREVKLYRHLRAAGVQVTFVTYGDERDLHYSKELGGIQVCSLYAGGRRPRTRVGAYLQSLFLPLRLGALVREADLLKTNQMWGSWVALLCGVLYGRPVILRCGVERYQNELRESHSRLYLFVLRQISTLCYRAASRIVLTTMGSAEFVTERLGIDPRKIHVLPNFVDTSSFSPLGITDNGKLLFIGRLSAVKNLFALIDAIAATEYELHIVGEGELRSALASHIRKVRANARLLGRVPNDQLPELINRYSIFVLPSCYEAHPKALIEAMACGAAVIGSDVPGIRSLIEHGRTGILASPDSESLREAITALMNDRRLRRELGARAREFVVAHFDLSDIARRELSLYRQTLLSRSRA